ncbi:MAG: TonB-dependent receptor plug domain-containing protein [Desulfuromonadaceae bacterium]
MKKRSKQQCGVVIGLVMAFSTTAGAQGKVTSLEEVVVTANRDEVQIEQVGSAITVITAKTIAQQQKQSVADVLRMVQGLDVVRSGGPGSITSVFLRGAKSGRTLVLIDGVEMNDPSSSDGGYDFAHLTTDNIERIEILRGPQSTLYGSSAMGGVINIITKRGDGKLKGFASAEGGSYHTAKETAGFSGGTDLVQYSLGLSRLDSDGISAANSINGNSENDPYQNSTVSARLGITPANNLVFDIALRYSKSRADLDGYSDVPPYSFSDVLGYYTKADQLYVRSEGDLSLFNNSWDQKLGFSLNDSKRNYSDGYYYNGQSRKLDWQHVLHLHKTNDFSFGLERKDEYATTDGMNEKHAATNSVYLQDQIKLFDSWFTTLGVRVDDHNLFGTEATYRFTTAYLIKQTGTKTRGSYGTGFRSPSLYELYAPPLPLFGFMGGAQNLKPEKSDGWDIGIEQGIPFMKASLGVTWFRNDFKDMIRYMTNSSYQSYFDNADKVHSQGLELTVSVQPMENLVLKSAYSYTETKDDDSGKQLTYRPKNKLSFDTNYGFLKQGNVNLGLVYVGTRYSDTDNTKKMKEYLLVNLAASFDVTKNLRIFGRVDNLFDRDYEEVTGYGTPGISAYGGVKVSF